MGFVDELLAEMEKERNDNRKPASAEELKSAYEQLETRHEFKPGDMVQWKPGLKDKNWPAYGEPALVVQIGGELGKDENREDGTPIRKHDMACLVKSPDGDLAVFAFESNRMEPYFA